MSDDTLNEIDKLPVAASAVRHRDAGPTALQDAAQFLDSGSTICDVVEHVRGEDDIERFVLERQSLRVAADQRCTCVITCCVKHPHRDVHADGFDEREIAAVSTANLKNAITVMDARQVKHPRE